MQNRKTSEAAISARCVVCWDASVGTDARQQDGMNGEARKQQQQSCARRYVYGSLVCMVYGCMRV